MVNLEKSREEQKVLATSATIAPTKPNFDRALIEFCCGEESLLCQSKFENAGCYCARLAAKTDLRKQTGIDHAKKLIQLIILR